MRSHFKIASFLSWFSLLILSTGCADSTEDPPQQPMYEGELALPTVNADSVGCDQEPAFGGGDLMREFDRIALGTISRIEVEEELNHPFDECSDGISWTLHIHVDVDENFKGDGDSLVFSIGVSTTEGWPSTPAHYRGGRWTPGGAPEIQLTSDFGWTGDSGLQVGQDLFLMLYDRPNGLTPFAAPIGQLVDGEIQFNSNVFGVFCVELHEDLLAGLSVDEMRQELTTPERAPDRSSPFENFDAEERSFCTPQSVVDGEPSQEEYEGTDPAMRTEETADD